MTVTQLKRIFVCEFITGGGLCGASLPMRLAAEGEMMLQSVIQDLMGLGGLEMRTTRDIRLVPLVLPLRIETVSFSEDIWSQWSRNINEVEAVWPIAPETGGILERLSRFVLESNRILLGSRPEAIAVAASKLATARHLAEYGIPVGETVPIDMPIPESEAGWVVKPEDGAGCENTHYFMEIGELHAWLKNERRSTYVLQPYIPGIPASLSMLCRDGRARVLACNQQLIEVRGSELHCAGIAVNALRAYHAELDPLAQRIAQALPGLWGYVGVDLVLMRHGPVVIEINPRLTTSYVGLGRSIGRNPAELILGLLRDENEPWVAPLQDDPVTVVLP